MNVSEFLQEHCFQKTQIDKGFIVLHAILSLSRQDAFLVMKSLRQVIQKPA